MPVHAFRLIAAAALTASATAAQAAAAATHDFPVVGFHGIGVAGPFEVRVVTGAAPRVTAVGDPAMIEATIVEVRDGTLKIRLRDHPRGPRWGYSRTVFTVVAPRLDHAALAGAGSLAIDRVDNDFSGTLAGAGTLSVDSLHARTARFESGGAGSIRVAGAVDTLSLSDAGSGRIFADRLASRTLAANVAGSGQVAARATQSASVSLVGSGSVRVAGGARCSVTRMGSGSVVCGATD
ncbi:head GIN domain-containing protein [Sphingomonas sp. ASV193]|uniref:head GIN domain-containing protein n=1 Tax=Sphingomonas sp. ASV193 TaxID=3144405 RepID=UPI0032E8C863